MKFKPFDDLGGKEYEVVATLDSHTSEICQNLNGKVFPIKDYQVGVTVPPFHVFCRSTTAPVLGDHTLELGGEYIPEDMPFEEWKKIYVDGENLVLTNAENGGIIKEQSKKPITEITDDAINRVPNVRILGYSDEQCDFIQQQHKELLKYARENNADKEVAFVFRSNLSDRSVFSGSDDQLEFGSALFGKGSDLFIMHNHPRNSSFSDVDLMLFKSLDSVKTLTIVKK